MNLDKIEHWCKENDIVQYNIGDGEGKIYNLDYDGYVKSEDKIEVVIKTISDSRCLIVFEGNPFSISIYKIIKIAKNDYYPDFTSKLEFDFDHIIQFKQWLTINTIFTSFPFVI
jgi:hypothetical protein